MTEDAYHQQASDPATAGGNNADLDITATELCFFFAYMVEFFGTCSFFQDRWDMGN